MRRGTRQFDKTFDSKPNLAARAKAIAICAALVLGLPAVPSRAEVNDQLEFRYYQARAEPGKSLFQALSAASPLHENGRVFLAHTDRTIDWRLHWHDVPGGCKIDDIRVTLHAVILLPQLSNVDQRRQAEYSRFLAALRTHEDGHYRFAQEASAQIDTALAQLPVMPNCRVLEETANSTGRSILDQEEKRNRQYDADTDHGRTQGAYLKN